MVTGQLCKHTRTSTERFWRVLRVFSEILEKQLPSM